MPETPDYLLLTPGKIAELRKLEQSAGKETEQFLRQFIEARGKESEQHGCKYVTVFYCDPYKNNTYKTLVIGLKDQKFFKWEQKGLHESLPEKLHEAVSNDRVLASCTCEASNAFWNLCFAMGWWKRGMQEDQTEETSPITHPADIKPIFMNNQCTASYAVYDELKSYKKEGIYPFRPR